MTDQSDLAKSKLSRRSLLKNVPIVVGAIASAAALPEMALAQTKLSHAVAKYQDQPKNEQKCSSCLQFMPPRSCKIVVDPISPDGWCQFYGSKTT
jgi:hypothetical protein